MVNKARYVAKRTSAFMPTDQGNKWVVICPDGLFYQLEDGSTDMKQNEAIALAKELNAKEN